MRLVSSPTIVTASLAVVVAAGLAACAGETIHATTVAAAPATPAMPATPAVPSVPSVPSVPAAPAVPAVPVATHEMKKVTASATYPLTTCVVSGEELGAMGGRVAYSYDGVEVQFCCPDCVAAFEKDPAPFLAKIAAAAK